MLRCYLMNILMKDLKEQSPKSYAEAVGFPELIELNLKFVQSEEVNGIQVAKFTKDDVVEQSRYWDSAMILCVLGANPPIDVIKGFIARMWKMYPIDEVSVLKEGQFIVMFQKEEDRDEVIKRKYYYFDNKPVLVQKWKPGKKVDITELKDIPIWIQLPDLDIKYWSLTGLSKLGSLIGKPIKRDKATATRMKYAYARIQVEVGVYQEFPKTITFINEEDRYGTQRKLWCKYSRVGGNPVTWEEIRDFKECMQINGLEELPAEGAQFTWSNRQGVGRRIYSRIDRAVINIEWIAQSRAKLIIKEEGMSDHTPLLIKLWKQDKGGHRFRFCDMWTMDPNFSNLVKENWEKCVQGRSMYQLVKKLKILKTQFKSLNREKFGNIIQRCDIVRNELYAVQHEIKGDINNELLINKEKQLIQQLNWNLRASYLLKCQQAKQEWILEGDQNSRLFHAWVRKRQIQNHITTIYNKRGELVEGMEDVTRVVLQYFQEALGTTELKEIEEMLARCKSKERNLRAATFNSCCYAIWRSVSQFESDRNQTNVQ
ncbi:unnamed protein product [Cuscuta campestris]|uniref:DUF4283 domain-containing protein n=1 Tax=Cuscuta campestris TaxID=132261 RepID=A0A484L7X3_9ASTE|nr:unnamed protein product [Cuscuta campestris]